MAAARSLEDRLLRRAIPRAIESCTPGPSELAPGVWALDRELRHFGAAALPARTTIAQLGGRDLAMISPPPLLTAESRAAIDALGDVRDIVAPNTFHYIYAAECARAFPGARLHLAPGLADRAPELAFASELEAAAPPTWAGHLEYAVLGPVRGVSEVLFFHAASATLVLSDLAFNMVNYRSAFDRLVWRSSGIPAGFAPGRTSRSMLLRDRGVASAALHRALEWPFGRIVVAHGEVVEDDAREKFRAAFAAYL